LTGFSLGFPNQSCSSVFLPNCPASHPSYTPLFFTLLCFSEALFLLSLPAQKDLVWTEFSVTFSCTQVPHQLYFNNVRLISGLDGRPKWAFRNPFSFLLSPPFPLRLVPTRFLPLSVVPTFASEKWMPPLETPPVMVQSPQCYTGSKLF